LDAEELQTAIAEFWDEYDHDDDLRGEVNRAAEAVKSFDPETRRRLVTVKAPGGTHPFWIDVFLDPILVKVTAELIWLMIQKWIAERNGVDALGERDPERDQDA